MMTFRLALFTALAMSAAGPSHAADAIEADMFTVIDGDTIEVDGATLHLAGIEAPELGWHCTLSGTPRDCGLIARSSLLDLTAGARLVCQEAGGEQYRCTAGGYDLSEGMVYTGWAVPLPGAPSAYARVLEEARARPRGFWRGTFTHTWPALDRLLD